MADTAAKVDMEITNNATWSDAFSFGVAGDVSWDFSSKTFSMDVKRDKYDASPLFTLTTGNSRIIIDDVVTRTLHFNVPDTDFNAILLVGEYVYDLIMTDAATVRTRLMHGKLKVRQGETED